ncbi:hypothetical protein RXV91_05835 [Lactiplantibacillus sp. DA1]|uniref:hypothetical protein n=1 Tax=Lactiplantibacillus sp. DA1 TaxID=3079857 RepID=UPI00292A60C4|nr:hypothetical protein [Lactiplantibacillus sp. DA1]MDV0430394.1 hypothetical protein [Lactiplantibacillus sp. DA1]
MTPNETYTALAQWHLLPATNFTWRPFTATTIYVDTPHSHRVYRLDLANTTVEIFQADPSSELSEHFLPFKTIKLTAAQINQWQHNQPITS